MANSIKLISGETDGATAIAHELDSIESFVTPGAKLFSLKQGGSEELYVDETGNLFFAHATAESLIIGRTIGSNGANFKAIILRDGNNGDYVFTGGGALYHTDGGGTEDTFDIGAGGNFFRVLGGAAGLAMQGSPITITPNGGSGSFDIQVPIENTHAVTLGGRVTFRDDINIGSANGLTNRVIYTDRTDQASSVAFAFDTLNAFSVAGAKLLSLRNNGTIQFEISHNGDLTVSNAGNELLKTLRGNDQLAGALFADQHIVELHNKDDSAYVQWSVSDDPAMFLTGFDGMPMLVNAFDTAGAANAGFALNYPSPGVVALGIDDFSGSKTGLVNVFCNNNVNDESAQIVASMTSGTDVMCQMRADDGATGGLGNGDRNANVYARLNATTNLPESVLESIKDAGVDKTTIEASEDASGVFNRLKVQEDSIIENEIEQRAADSTFKIGGNEKFKVNSSGTKTTGTHEVTGEFKMKVYSQDAEPTLGADDFMAMWIDTNDSNRTYLIFRRGSGDHVKVELT